MPNKPLKLLQASAGSGKTFSLTAHYLTLLFSGETKYREILAVTFTNKATEEMKTRILEVLKELAKGNATDGLINEMRRIILEAHPELNPQTLQLQADRIYRRILHDYGRFSVSTIDGFVQKVIRSFAFELGLDTGYALEMNFDKVKNELADRLDKQLDTNPGLLQWIINLAQDRIQNDKSWNYRRELTDLAGEIFKERYQPFEKAMEPLMKAGKMDELFTTYSDLTRQAIREFEEQVHRLAVDAAKTAELATANIDSLKGKSRSPLFNLQKIADGDLAKTESLSRLIDQPDEWFKPGSDTSVYDTLNPQLKQLYEYYTQNLADYLLAVSVNENLYFLRLMQEMAHLLESYRKESGTLLISDAQRMLQEITASEEGSGNPSFVWEKTGSRYQHFLFDEFQDTSTSQWGNFRPLLQNAIASANGKLTDHLVVGDVKQSIYRWRNGDWNILHQKIKADVGEEYIVEENLEANYRSAENIINFNNLLFQYAPQALQDQLNAIIASEAGEAAAKWWYEKGYHEIITNVYRHAPQLTHPQTAKGGHVHISVLTEDETGKSLRNESFRRVSVQKMIAEIQLITGEKGYKPGDICVLVRSNKEAVTVVEALMERHIPVISGEALMIANNNAVKLLVNTLRVLAGPANQTALYKANCISLYASLRHKTVLPQEWFYLQGKDLSRLKQVLPESLCNNWRTWMQLPLTGLIEELIGAYGLNHENDGSGHLPFLLAFRDMVGSFSAHGDKGIHAFLQWWDEEGNTKALPSAEGVEAVQVITIHKSKGLAFKAVLIPFCNWDVGGMPNSIFWVSSNETAYKSLQSIPVKYKKSLGKSAIAPAYYEELLNNNMDALNMLYVATTRSREYLSITVLGKNNPTDKITHTGDLMANVIDKFEGFDTGRNGLYIDEPVIKTQKEITEEILPEKLELTKYPLSERLSAVFDRALLHPEFELFAGGEAGREGAILHAALAKISEIAAVDKVLNEMLLQGYFKNDELEAIKLQISQVLRHPQLQNLLSGNYEILNERSIIAADGKSYRPDKVLVKNQEAIVLDYKFTHSEEEQHVQQVRRYKSLLLDMGYTQAKAYLFYAQSGALKLV
ncbi:AAA family ATPase [Pedobacter sp. BS3]|uniref:UvrD-helicase domain-containing protein n=1 Tax=Pedobacter sp. BS3 TaxID=2567937 RepID=UPI0011EE1B7E|nr:UvrD-helicase domain-containing protein [Pedobacter sp. BS3]TZF82057.1 AAA family ATPase [Pedobacter sp. BS3]